MDEHSESRPNDAHADPPRGIRDDIAHAHADADREARHEHIEPSRDVQRGGVREHRTEWPGRR